MPIINFSKSKKGKDIITIHFEDGKKMTAPPETNADESLNGKDVEVERENGQIKKIIYDEKILFETESKDLKNNSSLQKTFNNQSNKMHMKHTDDIKNPARAPYNFIPLNKTVVEAPEPPDFNEYHDNRLTGWINLNIETKTPLYIRDTLSIEDIKNENKSNNISSFYSPGGQIKIPGSSLRGMTRTMLEIVSYGKFGFFEDQPLYFRGLADKSNLRTEYQSKMTSYDRKNKKTQYKFNAGYLFTRGLNYFIKPADFDKIPKTKAEAKIKKSGKSYNIFNYYKISQSECIVVSGDMQNKKNDWLIYAPEKNEIEILVPEVDIISYHNDINRSQDVPNLIELSKSDEVPCFYVKWKDNSGKERVSFGHTGMFRLSYEKTISDHIPENLKDPLKIDFAETIFGKNDKFPSRVFFEDANLCEGQGDDILMKESTPKILSSPKPTSFQHYLVQSSDNIRSLNHYNSNTAIRGNKLYWHKSGYDWKENENIDNKNETQYTKIQPVKKGTKFTGKIRFENLTEEELGSLLFSLNLPEGCFHKLGMGKPLGLGSVKIKPELYISDRKNRYVDLFCEWNEKDINACNVDHYKTKFETYVLTKLGEKGKQSLWGLDRLEKLKIMSTGNNHSVVNENNYMELKKFKERFILPGPISKEKKQKNFYIVEIILINIRCFKKLVIPFSKRSEKCFSAIILGNNAKGKTTLLRCIAIALCKENDAIALLQIMNGDLIRNGENEGKIIVKLLNDETGEVYENRSIIRKKDDGQEIIQQDHKINWEEIFVCGYGVQRSSVGDKSYSEYSIKNAVMSLFDYEHRLQNVELIFRRMDNKMKKEIEKKILQILMMDPNKCSIICSNNGLEIKNYTGEIQNFNSLCDGHRTAVQWLFDFIAWSMHANKNDFGGILIIDELEQHIHPSWQRHIVQLLNDYFPKTQIIASTHTPLIASSGVDINNYSLIKLYENNNHEYVTQVTGRVLDKKKLKGKRADQILSSEAFDLYTTRSPGSEKKIDRYSELMGKKRNEKEEIEFKELAIQLKESLTLEENGIAQHIEQAISTYLDDSLTNVSPDLLNLETKRQLKELFED